MIARNRILVGDALTRLRELPDGSVDCVITSPPYYGLRDYGVPGQLGTEATLDEWIVHLVTVLDELGRVLKPTGTCWLNLGDAYSPHARFGVPKKSFLMAPERLVLQLVLRGWRLRNKVVWHKTNAFPTSAHDRLRPSWEPLYLLTRSDRYYFDLDAIREPHLTTTPRRGRRVAEVPIGPLANNRRGLGVTGDGIGHALGKNPGDVWSFGSSGRRQQTHPAVFPEALVVRPIRAGCPREVCDVCGWPVGGGLKPCGCGGGVVPGVVLDPFIGSGTVAVVAEREGRDWIGIELNPLYTQDARQRIERARGAGATDKVATNQERSEL